MDYVLTVVGAIIGHECLRYFAISTYRGWKYITLEDDCSMYESDGK